MLYTCKGYGILNLQLLVSATNCKPVKLLAWDRCWGWEVGLSVPEEGCLVVQPVYPEYNKDDMVYFYSLNLSCHTNVPPPKITTPGRAILYNAMGYLEGNLSQQNYPENKVSNITQVQINLNVELILSQA